MTGERKYGGERGRIQVGVDVDPICLTTKTCHARELCIRASLYIFMRSPKNKYDVQKGVEIRYNMYTNKKNSVVPSTLLHAPLCGGVVVLCC